MKDRTFEQKTAENKSGSTETQIANSRSRDAGAKLIFDNPILCAQFLRGYTNLEILKNIRPEDIEDISERFLPLWQENRDSDSVKRIRLHQVPGTDTLYLIAMIEHQSKVDYDMSFCVLRYMVLILTDYAAEQEKQCKGITGTKTFRYPPVLPVVFYDGPGNWTAETNFP